MTLEEDCGRHGGSSSSSDSDCDEEEKGGGGGGSAVGLIVGILGAVAVLILITILVIYLVLRPSKPSFILRDATVFSLFNSTTFPPPSNQQLLSTTLQVTLYSRNPNSKIGVYYEHLAAHASYRGRRITLTTLLPPVYQGHRDAVAWSPFLYGKAVEVDPKLAAEIQQDQMAGLVLVHVNLKGRVKWTVGSWVSGSYRLWVDCPAYISPGAGSNVVVQIGPAVKYQLATGCRVDVRL